jgi:hypothetical protein
MKEETNSTPSEEERDQPDADLVSMLENMQQQLHSLEKKMDLLISRSQERPFDERSRSPQARTFGRRPFSKPFRPNDHTHRHDKGEREHGSRDRESSPGHFYERRPQEKSHRPSPRKKPFGFKRKDRE